MDKEQARQNIANLIARWHSLSPAQIQRDYQEANTRKDFILPLFEALGWNTALADEVFEERRAASGAVDYAFRIRGVSRFYLEAKPLRAELTSNPDWVKQAVTYAYSKGIPWVVLTNFKDLWAFSGDVQPQRFLTLSADQYVDDFDLLQLLSKEAVEAGLLEEQAAKRGAFPPKVSVEKRLYQQLSQWRGQLFTQLHGWRKDLPFPVVDEVVQRLFNRLLFIRTCEDRRLEEPVLLPLVRQFQGRTLRGSLWDALKRVFADFDGAYDSELFAFHVLDQQDFFQPETLAQVIQGLYGPPGGLVAYDFSLIDADVLGRVYEQYLGYVAQIVQRRHHEIQLRLERGSSPEQALEEVVEVIERPQRRKARGIYYTPKWVVDYIVRQTVGRFIEEHKNRPDGPDAIHNLRILDMACGSGSFLIRAYDELLQYHMGTRPPEWVFSDERLAILRNNIFGVDLDPQAVEIARLNLLLRAVREPRRLPELAGSIKVGNALISGGEAELRPYFGDDWRDKRPFAWEQEFPQVMADGGFDVIIGNPPYIRIQSLDRDEADYYRHQYKAAYGSFDIYVLFIERGLDLLKPGGRLGFITSGKFLKAEYGKKLQTLLGDRATVEEIVDLSTQKVFADATTYPVLLVLQKGRQERALRYTFTGNPIESASDLHEAIATGTAQAPQEALTHGVWPPLTGGSQRLTEKMQSQSQPLGQLSSKIFQGIVTSADAVYFVENRGRLDNHNFRVFSRATGRIHEVEPDLLHPLLKGSVHMRRYHLAPTELLVLFPYHENSGRYELIPQATLERQWPLTWQYLLDNRQYLEARESGKMRHERWYAYVYPKNLESFNRPKILTPSLATSASFSYDAKGECYFVGSGGGGGGGYGIEVKEDVNIALPYLLGLLNSRPLDYYLHQISSPFRGGYRAYNRQYITKLPIRRIDFSNPTDKQMHDAIVAKVEEMLALQARLAPLRHTPTTERDDLLHQIALVDQQIDALVYDLYGLTQEERRLVEEA